MAAKTETACSSPSPKVSKELSFRRVSETLDLFRVMGGKVVAPENSNTNGFIDDFIRSFIKVDHIQRGRIALLSPKPLSVMAMEHCMEGAVGSLVEVLSTACARTVVTEDRELFLGGISISYLSGTPLNEEVLANASAVKTGRNLTLVAIDFKLKKNGNLLYTTNATFYNMPVSSL